MNVKNFNIVLNDLNLKVICDEKDYYCIYELMNGHSFIQFLNTTPTYTLIIDSNIVPKQYNLYVKMIDKWFDNASCDVWIDNDNKIVYMNNIVASLPIWRENLIKYFACNLFNRLMEEKGYIAFHSSCVEKDNKGIAFIAPRNYGKTSCMLALMSNGYNSITNDKLAIMKNNENELLGYGVAQDVSIRLSPSFISVPQNKMYLKFAEEQNVKIENENKLEGQSIHLESTELAKLNNVNQLPETLLNTFIFPNYDGSITNIKLKKMSKEEKENLLLTQKLPMVHDTTKFLSYITIDKYEKFTNDETIENILSRDFYQISQGEKSTEALVKTLGKINGTY